MAKYEEKFIVINGKDLNGLSPLMQSKLGEILKAVESYRKQRGAEPVAKYYVCNQDEPYAEQVINTILAGEDAKGLSS